MNETPDTLLAPEDLPAFTVGNETGRSPFLLVVDHAGKQIPACLGELGLATADRERHIAWDIGAGAVADMMGAALDAVVIRQNYSRLVIDCNRMPATDTSIVSLSESTPVPGNVGLSEAHRSTRVREVFDPYHNRIALELDRRHEAGRMTTLISVHSFTPLFKGVTRPWHIGVLYNRDVRFAHILLELLRREAGLAVGDNEPYSVSDESDYTIPVHGEKRALHHVGIEIRQDLVTGKIGQRKWATLLARLLRQAHARLGDG